MYALTDAEFEIEAEPLLRQIFNHSDPTVAPFAPNVSVRKILYPCFSNFEEAIPVRALVEAATSIGDAGCYISLWIKTPGEPNHCYIPLSEFEAGYAGPPDSDTLIGVQLGIHVYSCYTIIFSSTGRWGLMIVEEGLALLGGTPEFIAALEAKVPDLNQQVYAYLEDLRQSKLAGRRLTIEWLPGLLAHIYGTETAKRLLQEVEVM
jgi:hypothetical protein